MAKNEAEQSNRLTIFWLKKQGFLSNESSYRSGGIKWTYGSGDESNIDFSIVKDDWGTPNEEVSIKLEYTYTNGDTGEKEKIDYDIELTTTPCNYGGKRYWFICSLVKDGRYCGRRVGAIFSIGKWFGCRHCGRIAYGSQMQSGYNRGFVSIPDLEKAENDIGRYYYKGKPTRKYRRLIRLSEKFNTGFTAMAENLTNLYNKNTRKK